MSAGAQRSGQRGNGQRARPSRHLPPPKELLSLCPTLAVLRFAPGQSSAGALPLPSSPYHRALGFFPAPRRPGVDRRASALTQRQDSSEPLRLALERPAGLRRSGCLWGTPGWGSGVAVWGRRGFAAGNHPWSEAAPTDAPREPKTGSPSPCKGAAPAWARRALREGPDPLLSPLTGAEAALPASPGASETPQASPCAWGAPGCHVHGTPRAGSARGEAVVCWAPPVLPTGAEPAGSQIARLLLP